MKKNILLLALIGFGLKASAQTVTGGDMETWKSYSSLFTTMTKPNSWFTTDSIARFLLFTTSPTATYTPRITKSTTVFHAGTAAAKITSDASDTTIPTFLTNGYIDFMAALSGGSVDFTGGTNVTKRIMFVNAWIKFAKIASTDTGSIAVLAYKNGIGAGGADSMVGSGGIMLTNNISSFTKTGISIDYVDATIVPDRIIVLFFPSNNTIPSTGTTMYVDDVTISDPLGIETPMVNDPQIKVYPNPAINQLHINTDVNEELVVSLYNTLGQKVVTQIMQQSTDINVSGLTNGNYVYVVSSVATRHKYASGTFAKQ
jgi:hypothetical protein